MTFSELSILPMLFVFLPCILIPLLSKVAPNRGSEEWTKVPWIKGRALLLLCLQESSVGIPERDNKLLEEGQCLGKPHGDLGQVSTSSVILGCRHSINPPVKGWFRHEEYSQNPYVLRVGLQSNAAMWALGSDHPSPETLPSSTGGLRVQWPLGGSDWSAGLLEDMPLKSIICL